MAIVVIICIIGIVVTSWYGSRPERVGKCNLVDALWILAILGCGWSLASCIVGG